MSQNDQPVTKKDLLLGLAEFFENIIAPYFEEHIEKRLDEHDKRFDRIESKLESHDQSFESLERKVDLIAEKVTSHEKRIHALEITSPVS